MGAIFPISPALGYPPGVVPTYSLHGLIHALAVTLFFGCLSALCFVVGRRFVGDADWKGWALYSRLTGVVVAVFYIMTSVVTTLDMNGLLPDAPGGLLQRIAIISGFGWIMLLALRLLRKKPLKKPSLSSKPPCDEQEPEPEKPWKRPLLRRYSLSPLRMRRDGSSIAATFSLTKG
jgi:hypothetical protein